MPCRWQHAQLRAGDLLLPPGSAATVGHQLDTKLQHALFVACDGVAANEVARFVAHLESKELPRFVIHLADFYIKSEDIAGEFLGVGQRALHGICVHVCLDALLLHGDDLHGAVLRGFADLVRIGYKIIADDFTLPIDFENLGADALTGMTGDAARLDRDIFNRWHDRSAFMLANSDPCQK